MARPTHYQNQYRQQLLERIRSLPEQVFKRQDLVTDRSNQSQLRLNRALKAFVKQGYIKKIAHGLYAKAMQIGLPEGNQQTVLQDSFESVAIQALDKIGIRWDLGTSIQEYNRGETTQVPAVFSVRLRSRYRGTIRAEGKTLHFEGDVNAR